MRREAEKMRRQTREIRRQAEKTRRLTYVVVVLAVLLFLVIFFWKSDRDLVAEYEVSLRESMAGKDCSPILWNIVVSERNPRLCEYLMDHSLKEKCYLNAEEYDYKLSFDENLPSK